MSDLQRKKKATLKKRATDLAKRAPINHNPFCKKFDYGNAEGRDGYWDSHDVMNQTEDCMDVLDALFGDRFQYLFLFEKNMVLLFLFVSFSVVVAENDTIARGRVASLP